MQRLNAMLPKGGRAKDRRAELFLFSVLGLFAMIGSILSTLASYSGNLYPWLGAVFCFLAYTIAICAVVCGAPLTTRLLIGIFSLITIGLLIWDLNARTMSRTEWPLFVLVVDMMLVMQVPTQYSVGLVGFIVAWLILLALEEGFRFGLFELPGLPAQHGDYGRYSVQKERSDCVNLPCPTSFPSTNLMSSLSIFLLDFAVTRGFAHRVLKEQRTMERTVSTVQEIASLLARYDVEKVAELLEEHCDELPQGMTVALRALEANLRSYKAYLPQTCLLVDEDNQERESTSCASEEVSLSSPSSGSSTSTGRPVAMRNVSFELSSVKATLLTANIKRTLHLLEQDSAHFSSLFTSLLLKTLGASQARRGMVDVFIGDRVHCSFNTSKPCANHATSALHTATMLFRGLGLVQVNMVIASGKVLRGDMGCEVMRRFSMVGTLVRDVCGMERAGRILGCDVLCNRMCFSDAECEHALRLIPCRVEVSAACDTPEVVAELLYDKELSAETRGEEWMYIIGRNNEWYAYNEAVRKYLKGDVPAAAVEEAAQGCPCERPFNVHPSSLSGGLLSVALARPLREGGTIMSMKEGGAAFSSQSV